VCARVCVQFLPSRINLSSQVHQPHVFFKEYKSLLQELGKTLACSFWKSCSTLFPHWTQGAPFTTYSLPHVPSTYYMCESQAGPYAHVHAPCFCTGCPRVPPLPSSTPYLTYHQRMKCLLHRLVLLPARTLPIFTLDPGCRHCHRCSLLRALLFCGAVCVRQGGLVVDHKWEKKKKRKLRSEALPTSIKEET
jgi:hypothetical protein